MRGHRQLVLLETDDGTCTGDKMLKEIWEMRCKDHFPHYKVVMSKQVKKE